MDGKRRYDPEDKQDNSWLKWIGRKINQRKILVKILAGGAPIIIVLVADTPICQIMVEVSLRGLACSHRITSI